MIPIISQRQLTFLAGLDFQRSTVCHLGAMVIGKGVCWDFVENERGLKHRSREVLGGKVPWKENKIFENC
jgi:hypothetical protein